MRLDMILNPHLSEKTYALASATNTYAFKVDKKLNKPQVKALVEEEYDVEVIRVRTVNSSGKQARSIRLKTPQRRRLYGKRKDFKKVYVSLKAGDVIPVFTNFEQKDGTPT